MKFLPLLALLISPFVSALTRDDLQQRFTEQPVIRAHFDQTRTIKDLPQPLRSQGQMLIARDQGLLWDQTSPFPMQLLLDDKRMVRAGLDYHEFANLNIYESWDDFLKRAQPDTTRLFALTTKGSNVLTDTQFAAGDWFVFGSETRGLPDAVRESFPNQQRIRLPMMPNNRSLNLSNSAAIIVYEAWRQCGFAGGQ